MDEKFAFQFSGFFLAVSMATLLTFPFQRMNLGSGEAAHVQPPQQVYPKLQVLPKPLKIYTALYLSSSYHQIAEIILFLHSFWLVAF